MKRSGWLFAVLLAGCPEKEAVVVAPLPEADVARLVSLEGTVTLLRSGKTAPAAPGGLKERDELQTFEASKALVRAPGGREIELGEKTRFKLGKTLGDVEVSEGTISFLAADEGDGGVVSVTTRFGRTFVAPGTRAVLIAGVGGLAVDVSVGAIEQLAEDGGVQKAGAGQKLEVGVGAIEVVDPGVPEALKPLRLELSADGKVLLKKKGEARFSATKKGVQGLEAGTALQVAAGSKARVTGGGVSVRLPGAVTSTVESATVGEGGSALQLLVSGPVQVALDGKAPASVVFSGKNPVKLKGRTEAAAVISRSKVEVLLGELELEVNGKTQLVKAGEVAAVTSAGVFVAARPRPSVVLPMGKRVRIYGRQLGEVGLGLPDEAARTQVAHDAAFTEVVLSGTSKDFVAVQAPPQGELFWRTLDAGGQVTATGKVRFLPDVASHKDEKERSDQVAETGLKATVYFQSAVPTLTFTFPLGEGAKGYRFKVYRGNDLKTPLLERRATENKVTVEPGVFSEGSFVWYASPLDAAGNEKGGGRMNKMDIVFDNSLTTLALSSPRHQDRAEGAVAAGTAPLGSKLFVNGRQVALDASGRFRTPLPRLEQVVFRVLATDGSESYWVRRLKK